MEKKIIRVNKKSAGNVEISLKVLRYMISDSAHVELVQ